MSYLKSVYLISVILAGVLVSGCQPASKEPSLLETLTFHASFDDGLDADFAKGDPILYSQLQAQPEPQIETGLPPEALVDGSGRFGNCLFFNTPEGISGTRAFYWLKNNFPFEKENWEGSVSFWLRVTPEEDLRPGFTDPIQLTSKSALDAGLWVDFDREPPRIFRMGAFPDKELWNPGDQRPSEIPLEEKPMIPLDSSNFSRDRWTHIVMTIEGFNNAGIDSVAKLYVDGKLHQEMSGWEQTYTWDINKAQIRLGVNFVGAIDEVSCFNRALSASEVATLYALPNGVGGILEES